MVVYKTVGAISGQFKYDRLQSNYSRASEQRTLWERAFCPLFGGCPYLGGLLLFDYNHLSMMF